MLLKEQSFKLRKVLLLLQTSDSLLLILLDLVHLRPDSRFFGLYLVHLLLLFCLREVLIDTVVERVIQQMSIFRLLVLLE